MNAILEEKKENVAILGFRKSGKSTFLTVLHWALARSGSRWRIRPLGKTKEMINELTRRLFSQGLYPEPTPEGVDPPHMRFHVEIEARLLGLQEGDWFELQAADVPGTAVMGVFGDPSFRHFYETYVKDCAAIIFLIDPQERWLEGESLDPSLDDYYPPFFSILAELGEQTTKEMYAAFCVTKLDKEPDTPDSFIEDGYWNEMNLEEKATRILGTVTKAAIDQFFDRRRLRWFPVSATGYYTDERGKRKSQFIMRRVPGTDEEAAGIAKPRELAPLGVVEVVEWVFGSIAKRNIFDRTEKKLGAKAATVLDRLLRP